MSGNPLSSQHNSSLYTLLGQENGGVSIEDEKYNFILLLLQQHLTPQHRGWPP